VSLLLKRIAQSTGAGVCEIGPRLKIPFQVAARLLYASGWVKLNKPTVVAITASPQTVENVVSEKGHHAIVDFATGCLDWIWLRPLLEGRAAANQFVVSLAIFAILERVGNCTATGYSGEEDAFTLFGGREVRLDLPDRCRIAHIAVRLWRCVVSLDRQRARAEKQDGNCQLPGSVPVPPHRAMNDCSHRLDLVFGTTPHMLI
jgi:hypothetical protein